MCCMSKSQESRWRQSACNEPTKPDRPPPPARAASPDLPRASQLPSLEPSCASQLASARAARPCPSPPRAKSLDASNGKQRALFTQPRGATSPTRSHTPSLTPPSGPLLESFTGGSFAPLIPPSTPLHVGAHGPTPTPVALNSEAQLPLESAQPSSPPSSARISNDGGLVVDHTGNSEANLPTPSCTPDPLPNPLSVQGRTGGEVADLHRHQLPKSAQSPSKMTTEEAALLRRFEATLDDSQMLDPVVNFEEDELISSLFKRKGRPKAKCDGPKLKIDNKVMKKATKGKGKKRLEEDLGDGLLSAILNPDISPEELELCYGPYSGRSKP